MMPDGFRRAIRSADPAPRLRRVCAWCDPQHPMDNAGPVRPGELVSHGMCLLAYRASLEELGLGDGIGAPVLLLPAPGALRPVRDDDGAALERAREDAADRDAAGLAPFDDPDPDGDFLR